MQQWKGFTQRLARELMHLPANAFLVVQAQGGFPYVQAMRYPRSLSSEVVSNEFLPEPLWIGPEQHQRLAELDWAEPGQHGHVNWWQHVPLPADPDELTPDDSVACGRLAASMAAALHQVFGIRDPEDLEYRANRNGPDGGPLVLPYFGIPAVDSKYPADGTAASSASTAGRATSTAGSHIGTPGTPDPTIGTGSTPGRDNGTPSRDSGRASTTIGTPGRAGSTPGTVATGGHRSRLYYAATHARGTLITDRPLITDRAEVDRVAGYLRRGSGVLRGGMALDEVEPSLGQVVPVVYLTDGVWVWNAAQRYYLERYGIPPHPAFYEHIVAQGYQVPEVSDEVLVEAGDVAMGTLEPAPPPTASNPAPWLGLAPGLAGDPIEPAARSEQEAEPVTEPIRAIIEPEPATEPATAYPLVPLRPEPAAAHTPAGQPGTQPSRTAAGQSGPGRIPGGQPEPSRTAARQPEPEPTPGRTTSQSELEERLAEARERADHRTYFRLILSSELVLPATGDPADRQYATAEFHDGTYVLCYTSPGAMREALPEHPGYHHRIAFRELAENWPKAEWRLAINAGLSSAAFADPSTVENLADPAPTRAPTRAPAPHPAADPGPDPSPGPAVAQPVQEADPAQTQETARAQARRAAVARARRAGLPPALGHASAPAPEPTVAQPTVAQPPVAQPPVAQPPVPQPPAPHGSGTAVTPMQKVVPPEHVVHYLQHAYDQVAGYVHRLSDVRTLDTPERLVGALGLAYEGSPFSPGDDIIHVLRWPAVKHALFKPAIPRYAVNSIPEFQIDSQRLPHGAELYRLDRGGGEILVAVFDADRRRWRRSHA